MKIEDTGSNMNFILITIDSVRRDYLGCYSQTQSNTQHIDSLAAQSCVFDQAITNGSYTKTAFPPILSSTYASSHSGPFANVGKERPMLASFLKQHGFATGGFTSNPLVGTHVGYEEGFDVFEEPTPPPESRTWLRKKGAQRVLRSPLLNTFLMHAGVDTRPHPVYVPGQTITNAALQWLGQQKDRFFLWVHYMDAHWPYHESSDLSNGRSCANAWKDLQKMRRNRKSHPGSGVVERIQHLYRAGIGRIDREIGRLMRHLKSAGLSSRTVIAIASDHGEAFYEHGRWQHGAYVDFHEEVVRVPLIIHVPGLRARRRIAEQVTLLDLAPTVLDALSLPANPQMVGRSVYPAVLGIKAIEPAFALTEMIGQNTWAVSVRTPEFKYIYDERNPERRVLYDLQNDPGETTNRWRQLPETEASLETQLADHLEIVARGSNRRGGHWRTGPEVMRRLRALGYVE